MNHEFWRVEFEIERPALGKSVVPCPVRIMSSQHIASGNYVVQKVIQKIGNRVFAINRIFTIYRAAATNR